MSVISDPLVETNTRTVSQSLLIITITLALMDLGSQSE